MDHLLDDEELPRHERELTLSTGAILGIFLGLAVLCGGFFGFGYNMGRKSAPTPLSLSDINTTDPTLASSTGAAKPAAGTPLSDNTAVVAPTTTTPKPARKPPAAPVVTETAGTAPGADDTLPARPATPRSTPAANPAAPVVRQPAPVAPSALNPSLAPPGSTSAGTAGTGTFMVQVAAVSHQEDADLLVGALRGRGYSVSARPATSDKFIHVQVGPFHDKKEADAMRQRLLTDGYNAIVK